MKQGNEQARMIRLMIVSGLNILILMIMGMTILYGGERWMLLSLTGLLIVIWYVYLKEIGFRTYAVDFYGFSFLFLIFYFGIHFSDLYGISLLMTVYFVCFAYEEKPRLLKYGLLLYAGLSIYSLVNTVIESGRQSAFREVVYSLFAVMLTLLVEKLMQMGIKNRKQQRKNEEDLQKEIEVTSHRTENFMTNVSHELRTPINAVMGIASIRIAKETDPDRYEEMVSVYKAGHRLYDQISDILDYTELDTGRALLSEDDYVITSLLNDILNDFSEINHSLELVVDIDTQIPYMLYGDSRRIRKIIHHLLDNAVKFTKKGGVLLHVYAAERDYGINLCIDVEDTGIGISEEEQHRISRGFYQTDAERNRNAGGMGLGLPVVVGLTHAMGGFLKLESKLDEGTKVHVSIPQKIKDTRNCISIKDQESQCIALYIRPDKYTVPAIREYYNEMMQSFSISQKFRFYRANTKHDLDKILGIYNVTHLFLAQEEYDESPGFYEELCDSMQVVLITAEPQNVSPNSRMMVMPKPFYALSVVNILNAEKGIDRTDFSLEERKIVFPGLKVLIVDDEKMNLVVAGGIFRDYGMQVDTALSGKEAIGKYEEQEYDVIFMDHMMPEMDGVETMKHMRAMSSASATKAVIIALTANAVSGAREMFLQEGFDEFISKPIELLELERTLRKVLDETKFVYEDRGTAIKNSLAAERAEINTDAESEGLVTRVGLAHCLGDMEFYKEILHSFSEETKMLMETAAEDYSRKSWKEYRVSLRRLKDTAALVGAKKLSRQAELSEESLLHNLGMELDRDWERLCFIYRNTMEAVDQFLAGQRA